MTLWRSLRAIGRLLTLIDWQCTYCSAQNETSHLVWNDVNLTCRACGLVQPRGTDGRPMRRTS